MTGEISLETLVQEQSVTFVVINPRAKFTCAEQRPLLVIRCNNVDRRLLVPEQSDGKDQDWEDESNCRG